MLQQLPLHCPYCGEPSDLLVDEAGGEFQEYVEDCPVCCRPWEVQVVQNVDGTWSGSLLTLDE